MNDNDRKIKSFERLARNDLFEALNALQALVSKEVDEKKPSTAPITSLFNSFFKNSVQRYRMPSDGPVYFALQIHKEVFYCCQLVNSIHPWMIRQLEALATIDLANPILPASILDNKDQLSEVTYHYTVHVASIIAETLLQVIHMVLAGKTDKQRESSDSDVAVPTITVTTTPSRRSTRTRRPVSAAAAAGTITNGRSHNDLLWVKTQSIFENPMRAYFDTLQTNPGLFTTLLPWLSTKTTEEASDISNHYTFFARRPRVVPAASSSSPLKPSFVIGIKGSILVDQARDNPPTVLVGISDRFSYTPLSRPAAIFNPNYVITGNATPISPAEDSLKRLRYRYISILVHYHPNNTLLYGLYPIEYLTRGSIGDILNRIVKNNGSDDNHALALALQGWLRSYYLQAVSYAPPDETFFFDGQL